MIKLVINYLVVILFFIPFVVVSGTISARTIGGITLRIFVI